MCCIEHNLPQISLKEAKLQYSGLMFYKIPGFVLVYVRLVDINEQLVVTLYNLAKILK